MCTNEVKGKDNLVAGRDININGSNQPISSTYIFDPAVLADIINALSENIGNEPSDIDDFTLLDLEEKNQLNGVDQDFFDDIIKEYYAEFFLFDDFFKNPSNKEFKEKYKCILTELKGRIYSDLCRGIKLQDILPALFDYAKINHRVLFQKNGHLLNVLAYYMYTRCDIGKKDKNDKTR